MFFIILKIFITKMINKHLLKIHSLYLLRVCSILGVPRHLSVKVYTQVPDSILTVDCCLTFDWKFSDPLGKAYASDFLQLIRSGCNRYSGYPRRINFKINLSCETLLSNASRTSSTSMAADCLWFNLSETISTTFLRWCPPPSFPQKPCWKSGKVLLETLLILHERFS